MAAQYDIRRDPNGWTVYDTISGEPAAVNGSAQIDLRVEDADDLADLLNRLHSDNRPWRRTDGGQAVLRDGAGPCASRTTDKERAPSMGNGR